jgi:hypothetical protein
MDQTSLKRDINVIAKIDNTPPIVFFGRDDQTREILDFFTNLDDFPGGVQVIGTRNSGRTSFLMHLEQVYADKDSLRNLFGSSKAYYPRVCDNIIMTYLELNDVSSPLSFFSKLMGKLKSTLVKKFAPELENNLPDNIRTVIGDKKAKETAEEMINRFIPAVPKELAMVDDFDKWFNSLLVKFPNARFVFLLDHFDEMLCLKKNFDIEFLRKMRSLASKHCLCWVMSSHFDILDRNNPMKIPPDSPLVNIIRKRIILGRLNPDDERQIIRDESNIRFEELSDEEIEIVRQIAGPWPRIIRRVTQQWILYKVITSLTERREKAENYLVNKSQTIASCFVSYWGELTEEEEAFLIHQAHLPAENTLKVPETLLDFGIVAKTETDSSEFVITSPLFAMWIKKNRDFKV